MPGRSIGGYFGSRSTTKISIQLLFLGLAFFILWLARYSWRIISNPYPGEYREGAILLMTDSFIRGTNPFSLANHPLMNNNYGFLYNSVVLPFAILFGNTFAVHRTISILFILASCTLIVWTLRKTGTVLVFAVAGGTILLASLLFSGIPLANPDGFAEFFFLLAILSPFYGSFNAPALIVSGAAGIVAFIAKPYFLLAIGIVAAYTFLFVSKKKGLIYGVTVFGFLIFILYLIAMFFECYVLDVILNNIGNSNLSTWYMVQQLKLFIEIFLPCLLILFLAEGLKITYLFSNPASFFRNGNWLDILHINQPLATFPMDYFGFYFLCSSMVVIFLLGKHMGAYMSYFLQLITPALLLFALQHKNISKPYAAVTVPLLLANIFAICFGLLYPNQLSSSQDKDWEKLYRYLSNSGQVLNSPVLVSQMIRLGMLPADSGQSEYFFNTLPYRPNPFAPDYEAVRLQGTNYLGLIRTKVLNQDYDRVMVTLDQNFSPFAEHALIDRYYERVDLIHITMPQTNESWTIEVSEPRK